MTEPAKGTTVCAGGVGHAASCFRTAKQRRSCSFRERNSLEYMKGLIKNRESVFSFLSH